MGLPSSVDMPVRLGCATAPWGDEQDQNWCEKERPQPEGPAPKKHPAEDRMPTDTSIPSHNSMPLPGPSCPQRPMHRPPPDDAHPHRLVALDRDHPGFRDAAYRARRDAIAASALAYRSGPVPAVPYTEAEHGVWQQIWRALDPLHQSWAPRGFLVLHRRLALSRDRIPQLEEVNRRLVDVCGFRMQPVAGLIEPRAFLSRLADDHFLATQYIRHHSTPLYTPEPDVVHELIGHAASFTHPMIVELNRAFGRAARVATDAAVQRLERVYWWTMEFGALRENGALKAFGAGLLSSFGELGSFAERAALRPFDVDAMARTDYDPTDYQPQIFVADSWEEMYYELAEWLGAATRVSRGGPPHTP